jgi:predicted DsbA family dithiol-disulfide isomerase
METKDFDTVQRLTIDVWADVLCPWCYVGEERLSQAIEQSPLADRIDLKVHTFELDASAPKTIMPTLAYLSKKYGVSAAQARSMEETMARKAREVGLKYEVDRPVSNTFDMLRLIHLGSAHGVAWDYLRAMQKEVFGGNRDAFEHDTLIRLGSSLGIPEDEIRDVLSSGRYAEDVRNDHHAGIAQGAAGVPFTVIGGRLAIRGAVNTEDFVSAIQQGWETVNG